MSAGGSKEWKEYTPGRDELERITARFNDPADPLKIIIVTAKLLTGFDAPILYAQYLDKPLKEQRPLVAHDSAHRRASGDPRGAVHRPGRPPCAGAGEPRLRTTRPALAG
ncbi:type I restriction enzyme subunit R domain-containing protein [Micromonospora zamorensis]|uniref:type I restriction enzyme subunit R domain-containing protein n=1 Tax=Micromonospora zamorensis TaxID=709883 RepID=UPI0037A8218A